MVCTSSISLLVIDLFAFYGFQIKTFSQQTNKKLRKECRKHAEKNEQKLSKLELTCLNSLYSIHTYDFYHYSSSCEQNLLKQFLEQKGTNDLMQKNARR